MSSLFQPRVSSLPLAEVQYLLSVLRGQQLELGLGTWAALNVCSYAHQQLFPDGADGPMDLKDESASEEFCLETTLDQLACLPTEGEPAQAQQLGIDWKSLMLEVVKVFLSKWLSR